MIKERLKTRTIALIITVVILMQYVSVLLPFLQTIAATCTANEITWYYELDSNGNAIDVKPNSLNNIPKNITVPDKLDGHTVIEIAEKAFYRCSNIEEVTLPDSIIKIGKQAFYDCYYLSKINIPEGVTEICDEAFRYCSSLNEIIIPRSIRNIGKYAFHFCEITNNIEIPEGVTSIEKNTFSYCEMRKVTLPNTVTNIKSEAFANNSELSLIEIPNSVTSIANDAFKDCSSVSFVCNTDSYAFNYAVANNINVTSGIYKDENEIEWIYTK